MKKALQIQPPKTAPGSTFTALQTSEQILNEFVSAELESLKKEESGQNNCHVLDCAKVARGLIASYPPNESWSFENFLVLARHLEIDFLDMQAFFRKFVRAQEQAGRVRSIESVYDQNLYVFI